MNRSFPFIVFSHLRWDFVYQRPQHLLSRLAKRHPVYFFEEPVFAPDAEPHLQVSNPEPGVVVLRPHTSVTVPGYSEPQMDTLRRLLQEFVLKEKVSGYAVWMYTPMALPLLRALTPDAIVYDCMDELSAFKNAPRELLEREQELLSRADVVFTGGRSLYRAKKGSHTNLHCFPSSVDTAHFSRGVAELPEAGDQVNLPHPRLGYYGVIDERIDLQLLEELAASHPDWQIVMVGPVVKIDPATLPKYANLHYFGQRKYQELPAYLKGWDVCIQPFAKNEATRFISPTKVLEYMAADKLIVSTAITDVVEPYGHFVYVAEDSGQFVRQCEAALAADATERNRRLGNARRVLAETSWDRTADEMQSLLEAAVAGRHPEETEETAQQDVIIIGAGPTGLSAAYHLGEKSLLLEQNDTVGGWCRSIQQDGFTFDYAGHIMFSGDPYVHQLYKMLLGDNVHWQDREAWIYSKNVYTRYPFQGSLYGLPPEVIKECIVGAVEARFGSLKQVTNGKANGHSAPAATPACSKDASITDCCADGILESSTKLAVAEPTSSKPAEPANFEEFIYKVWGAGIAKHFAIPYNRKLWAVPLSEMETSWLGGRVPMPNLDEMIDGALKPTPKPMGPNARFGYPLQGGFQALMNGFLPHLKGGMRTGATVTSIDPEKQVVRLADGSEYRFRQLVSTMPLPALVKAMGTAAPAEIRQAARTLRHVSVRCVNLGVARENLTEKHWIYYPEDTVFHRIFVQGNASPGCNPAGGFGLTCEITYSEYKPLPCDGDALIERCIADCRKVGIFGADDSILTSNQVDMPYAYVVYDHARKHSVELIREWLAERHILLAGRYSEWEYYNSDHAFIAGKKIAEEVLANEERMLQTSYGVATLQVSESAQLVN